MRLYLLSPGRNLAPSPQRESVRGLTGSLAPSQTGRGTKRVEGTVRSQVKQQPVSRDSPGADCETGRTLRPTALPSRTLAPEGTVHSQSTGNEFHFLFFGRILPKSGGGLEALRP